MGRKAGLTDEKLLAVVNNDLSVFSDVEKLVIELADAMADTPSNISDELYGRLHEKFSEEFKMAMKALKKFVEMSRQHSPYLLRKAQRIEEYLNQR